MKAALLFAGSGPLVVLTSHASFNDPTLLEKHGAKGIDKFIAYEIPLDLAQERYGNHFQVVLRHLHEADDLRVLDFNGQRAFGLFHLSELGSPIFVENGRAGEAG
ncbi:MAG: cytosolic protein [Candidatus Angelobacter sp.]|jgi:hypothetical protein